VAGYWPISPSTRAVPRPAGCGYVGRSREGARSGACSAAKRVQQRALATGREAAVVSRRGVGPGGGIRWAGFEFGGGQRIGLSGSVTATAGRTRTGAACERIPFLIDPSDALDLAAESLGTGRVANNARSPGHSQQWRRQAGNWAVTTCDEKGRFEGKVRRGRSLGRLVFALQCSEH